MKEKRRAAQGEAGLQVARPGLVIGEGALRGRAAGKEPLRQRNLWQPADSIDMSELQRARQYNVLANGVVSGVAQNEPRVIRLRGKRGERNAHVHRVQDAAVRVRGIIAAVIDVG